MPASRPNISEDLYKELGLDPTATIQDIKRAFRQIARECHPDVAGATPEAVEHFKRARQAYETLVDPVARAHYDRRSSRDGLPFEGFWGAAGRPGGPREGGPSGNDLDLEDLFRDFGHFTDFGFGRTGNATHDTSAPKPAGAGRTSRERESLHAGQPLPPPRPEPELGSLESGTRKDPLPFAISVTEALLGGRVEVATPGGTVRLVVPPCTSSDAVFRVRGKGPSNAANQRDNLFLRARIVAPSSLDAESRALLLEFARLNPYDPRQGDEPGPPGRRRGP